jgi:hypothetical protein
MDPHGEQTRPRGEPRCSINTARFGVFCAGPRCGLPQSSRVVRHGSQSGSNATGVQPPTLGPWPLGPWPPHAESGARANSALDRCDSLCRDRHTLADPKQVLVSACFLPTAFASLPFASSLAPLVTLLAAFFTEPLACFTAASIPASFLPASAANRRVLNRAVFSRTARPSASYSSIACAPSRARSSFLKRASIRCEVSFELFAKLISYSVFNLGRPGRAQAGCVDAPPANGQCLCIGG